MSYAHICGQCCVCVCRDSGQFCWMRTCLLLSNEWKGEYDYISRLSIWLEISIGYPLSNTNIHGIIVCMAKHSFHFHWLIYHMLLPFFLIAFGFEFFIFVCVDFFFFSKIKTFLRSFVSPLAITLPSFLFGNTNTYTCPYMYEWSRPNRSNKNQLTPLSVRIHVVLFYCAYANMFLDNLRIFYLTRVFASNLFISNHLKLPFALFFISIKFAIFMLRFSFFLEFFFWFINISFKHRKNTPFSEKKQNISEV